MIALKKTKLTTVEVIPPRNLPWEPARAENLMQTLFAISNTFALNLRASADKIGWYITIRTSKVKALENAVYGYYPASIVQTLEEPLSDLESYLFHFEGATPFIGPLAYASDSRRLDPLIALLNYLTGLGTEEVVCVSVSLAPARKEIYDLGEKLVTISATKWWHFLTPHTAGIAVANKAMWGDKRDRFEPQFQRLVSAKLGSNLREAALAVKVRATSLQRAKELVSSVRVGLDSFGRDGSNLLVRPGKATFPLVLASAEVATLWHLPSDQFTLPEVQYSSGATAPVPLALTRASKGVPFGRNSFRGQDKPVWVHNVDRVSHISILGKTGTGKSTLMHRMIHHDIHQGKSVGLVDPHGDLAKKVLAASIASGRESDVVLLDVSDKDCAVGLNLFATPVGISKEAMAGQILSVIRKLYEDSWSATRMEDVLYACLSSLLYYEHATIEDVTRILNDSGFRAKLLRQVEDPIALDYWLYEYEPLSPAHQLEISRPITHRIRRFYRSPKIRPIICQTSSLDFRRIIDGKTIFVADLGGLDSIEAETLGALLISKFQLAAMSRGELAQGDRTPFYLYVDELQNFTTTSISQIFSEARKYGLSFVAANQYLRQLAGDTLAAIMGNVGTTILFALGHDDAKQMAHYVRPEFTVDDLLNLDKFSAVVKTQFQGAHLPAFSLRTLPGPQAVAGWQRRVAQIRQFSCGRYGRSRQEVEKEISQRIRREASRRKDSSVDDDIDYFD